MHKRMLTAKQTILPCGDVMHLESPIAKTQSNFSSLTMCGIPFFTKNIYFMHVCSACGT